MQEGAHVADRERLRVARNREIRLDEDATGAIERRPQRPRQRRRRYAGGPEHRACADLLAPEPHGVGGHPGHGDARAYLDTDALQSVLRRARERFGKSGEDARGALHQDDARSRGIDQPEVARDGLARDLAERPRQLDARWTAADDYEREERLLLGAIALALGRFVGQQHAAPDLERVFEGLEPRRQQLPVVVAEVRVAGTRREDQRVVGDLAAIEDHPAAGQIHALHVRQEDGHVRGAAQDGA